MPIAKRKIVEAGLCGASGIDRIDFEKKWDG
jgi:hypothetical protein